MMPADGPVLALYLGALGIRRKIPRLGARVLAQLAQLAQTRVT